MITKIEKFKRVENPEQGETLAFQLVKVTYNFFGRLVESTFDTRITEKGQFIIGGDGFFKHDSRVPV